MFQHSPLDSVSDSIRLIQITPGSKDDPLHCKLRHASFSNADYIALSYEWGPPGNVVSATINTERAEIRKNLSNFLLEIRRKGETAWLWIDSLCIDQSNIQERNEQVKRMGQIYSNAREVWTWLGPAPTIAAMSVAELFDLSQSPCEQDIARYTPAVTEKSWPSYKADPRFRALLKMHKWRSEGKSVWQDVMGDIIRRSYWNRMWIVQEFLLATSVRIWVGDVVIPAEHLSAFLYQIATNDSLSIPREFNTQNYKSGLWSLDSERRGDYLHSNSIDHVIRQYGQLGCSDWHDKVFALLSLVTNGHHFRVDYRTDKVSLIMQVLHFERTGTKEYFEPPYRTALRLSDQLGLTDDDIFGHRSDVQTTVQGPKYHQSLPLLPLGRVEKADASDNDASWKLVDTTSHFDECFNESFDVRPCDCEDCISSNVLQHGDMLYQIDSGTASIIVLRRGHEFKERGYVDAYIGAVVHVRKGMKIMLHQSCNLDSRYDMMASVQLGSAEDESSTLDLNPVSLGLLMHIEREAGQKETL